MMSKLAGLLLFVSSALAACPSGSHYDSTYKKCYKHFTTPSDYMFAEISCRSEGGSLVSIQNAHENAYVAAITSCLSTEDFWIGANYLMTTKLAWTSRQVVNYTNFAPGQPAENETTVYKCVALRGSDHMWTKERCSNQKPYLCQIEPNENSEDNTQSTPRITVATATAYTITKPYITPTSPNTAFPMTTAGPDSCEPGWTVNPRTGRCYKMYARNCTYFKDADSYCKAESGALSVIRNEEENNFLVSLIGMAPVDRLPLPRNPVEPFIGLYCTASSTDSCRWPNGNRPTYSNFAKDEPKPNWPAVYLSERNNLWYSIPTDRCTNGYVCEKPPLNRMTTERAVTTTSSTTLRATKTKATTSTTPTASATSTTRTPMTTTTLPPTTTTKPTVIPRTTTLMTRTLATTTSAATTTVTAICIPDDVPATLPPGSCDTGYTRSPVSGNCYKVVRQQSNYISSALACDAENATLAKIRNEQENDFVVGLVRGDRPTSVIIQPWIGLYCRNGTVEGCNWADYSSLCYSNLVKGSIVQQIVLLNERNKMWSTTTIATYQGFVSSGGFICEKPPMGTFSVLKSEEKHPVPSPAEQKNTTKCTLEESPDVLPPGSCDPGYIRSPGSGNCYKFVRQQVTYAASALACESENATLAKIHNEKENNFLLNLVRGNRPTSVTLQPWIGLACSNATIESCEWSDYTPVCYSNLATGHPVNGLPLAVFNERENRWFTYTIATFVEGLTITNGYICEKKANPV